MRDGLWVQEVRVSYNDTYQIRITLCFQSIRLNKNLTFDRVERVNDEQIRRAIADAVMQLFEEAAKRAIEHLYVNVRRTFRTLLRDTIKAGHVPCYSSAAHKLN